MGLYRLTVYGTGQKTMYTGESRGPVQCTSKHAELSLCSILSHFSKHTELWFVISLQYSVLNKKSPLNKTNRNKQLPMQPIKSKVYSTFSQYASVFQMVYPSFVENCFVKVIIHNGMKSFQKNIFILINSCYSLLCIWVFLSSKNGHLCFTYDWILCITKP